MKGLNNAGTDLAVIQAGEDYLARWKANAPLYARMAGACWGASRWSEAVRYGRIALALRSGDAQTAIFVLAAYRALDPARGIVFGEAWLRRQPGTAKIYRHLSFLYDTLDRHAEALAAARRGLQLDPYDRRLAACTANYLAKAEGPASALSFAEEYKDHFARDDYCQNTLADGLSSAGAYAESEKLFRELHLRNPADPKYLGSLLDACYHQGRYAEVVTAVERWEKGHALNAQLANEAGRACLELDRNDEALTWMQRAVALAPDAGKYADNLAITLGRIGRHTESIAACRQRLTATGQPDRRRLLTSIAVSHTELGQHAEALPVYQQTFAEFPDNGEALVNVMVGFIWLKHFAEAVEFGQQFREARGARLPIRFWSELAWACHRAGWYETEEAVIRDWARLHPGDPDVARTMRRALNARQRREDARTFLLEWVRVHPQSARGWMQLAEQYEDMEQADDELAAWREAGRCAPAEAGPVVGLIACLRRLNRAAEAFEAGTRWLAAHTGQATAELFNRIGLAADDLGRWPVAEEYYRRAHETEPRSATWVGNLLRAIICQQRAQQAVDIGERWLKANPWNNYLAGKQAWALRAAGRRAEESALLGRILQADPADEESGHFLLSSLIAQQRTAEAGELLAQWLEAGRATGRWCNDWGNHLRDLGRHAEAEAAYRRTLDIDPDNEVAVGNLASLQIHCGQTGDAVSLCRGWLGRRPADHYVRRQLANALYTIDDFKAAEEEYATLRKTEPDSAFLCGRWVACLRLLGRYEEALQKGNDWLGQQPGTPFLRVELGIAAHRLGRKETALAHYEEALKLEPSFGAAALRKLRILGDSDQPRRAIEFGEQWSAAHPAAADADFHNELGIILDREGRRGDAERSFLRSVELNPHNATLAGNAVDILVRNGRLEDGIRCGQRLLASNPPNAYLLRRLAEAYAAHHEHPAALDLLDTAHNLEPGDVDVALAYFRIAQEARESERGVEFGRRWLARPENERQVAVWKSFARLCFQADHDDEAFAAAERASGLEPDEIAHVRLRLGFLSALDESSRLVQEFEALRPEWQEDAVLLRYASRARLDLGMEVEALQLAVRNLETNPADEGACAWLGELHDRCGRPNEARTCLERWVAVHGEQPAVLVVRGRLAFDRKDYGQALADAEQVLRGDPTHEECFALCIRALRANGRAEEAKVRLNHWLEHQSSSPLILRLLDEPAADTKEEG